eukprot:206737-Chlamydomonas_euryale.AAC.5
MLPSARHQEACISRIGAQRRSILWLCCACTLVCPPLRCAAVAVYRGVTPSAGVAAPPWLLLSSTSPDGSWLQVVPMRRFSSAATHAANMPPPSAAADSTHGHSGCCHAVFTEAMPSAMLMTAKRRRARPVQWCCHEGDTKEG